MHMVSFTSRESGKTFWFPTFDILYITQVDGKTTVCVKDRLNNKSWDILTVESAQQIVAQL